MKKVCKIRIYPNKTQESIINRTLGACRFIYNKYIEYNITYYKETGKFLKAYDFSSILTQMKKTEEFSWLNEISRKALVESVMTCEKSYKNFFRKKQPKPPRFRSKKQPVQSYFFVKDNIHFNTGKKNIIHIPILRYIRITERNYLPDEKQVTSGRIIKEDDKYYAMFIYDTDIKESTIRTVGCGIDLGIEKFATIHYKTGNTMIIESFVNSDKFKAINEKIKYYQRLISHKVEINYGILTNKYLNHHPDGKIPETYQNIMKGESYNTSQIQRLKKKISKLYKKKVNIAKDTILKLVDILVTRTKPRYITIEDLNIKNMIETEGFHDLHRLITESRWFFFKERLSQKCKEYNIELRIANKFLASSKTCSSCGKKHKNLKLSDRMFICPHCGYKINRDLNASINLCNTKKYSLI